MFRYGLKGECSFVRGRVQDGSDGGNSRRRPVGGYEVEVSFCRTSTEG